MRHVQNVSKIIIGVVSLIVTLPFIYDLIDQQEEIDESKIIEITNTQLIGYNKGNMTWKMFANNIWSKNKKNYYYADQIIAGVIYDTNGDIIIDSISANNLTINTKNNSFSIYDGLTARFNLDRESIEDGLIAVENNKEQIKVKSNQMRYFSDNKYTYLSDDVELIKEDTVIRPLKEVQIDNEDNIAYIYHGFNLVTPEVSVTGNQMIMYIDDRFSEFKGDLVFEQFPSENFDESLDEKEQLLRKERTFLYANYATFQESPTKNHLKVSENITLVQRSKHITAAFAEYIEELDLFKMTDQVVIELEDLDWLLDKKTKESMINEDIKSSLNDKTTIYCDRLIFNGNKQETKLIGNVKIVQSDKTIYCKKLVLYDETAIVECIGDVKVIKDNADTMTTQFLTIDLNNEVFTAKKGVYSEYHLEN
mgnify:CR=1 FL=1